MKVELNDNLYMSLIELVELSVSNGLSDDKPDEREKLRKLIESVVDDAVMAYLTRYININETLWKWNETFQLMNHHYKNYIKEQWTIATGKN